MANATQALRRANRQYRRATASGDPAAIAAAQGKLNTATTAAQARQQRREAAGKQTGAVTQALERTQTLTGAPAAAPAPTTATPTPTAGAPDFTAGATGTTPTPDTATPTGATTSTGTTAAPAAPPTFTEALNTQFGGQNPFTGQSANLAAMMGQLAAPGSAVQPLGLFGNPLQTAQDRAQYLLDQNLARLGGTMGAAGMGNSSRAALMRGSAIGEAATGLGDILAQRGLETRQSDLDRLLAGATAQGGFNQQDASRALQAFLGAGQLGQGQQALDQQATSQLLQNLGNLVNIGTGVTGIGTSEQTPPLLQYILGALGNFGNVSGQALTGGETSTGQWL